MNTPRKLAITQTKQRAEDLASQIVRRGTRDGAGEAPHTNADTARSILDEAQNRLREFQEWGKTQINRISEVGDENRIRESADRVLAAIDVKREELLAWIDEQALRAWEKACRELEELNERG
jgi:hypothetical protein